MPYIPEDEWPPLLDALRPLLEHLARDGWRKGTCNAAISEIVGRFAIAQGGTRYKHLSEAKSLTADVDREFGRNLDAYEDLARKRNGDVPAYAVLRHELQDKWCEYRNRQAKGSAAPGHICRGEPGQ